MAKLTNKQRLFIQEYLIDKNATRAAIAAGYSKKTAAQTGAENIRKPYIREAIESAIKAKEDELIAKQDEVLKYFSSTMRGQIKEECVVVESVGDFQSEARVIEKQVSPKDRNKAAELLAKHYKLLTDNVNLSGELGVMIIDDIPNTN